MTDSKMITITDIAKEIDIDYEVLLDGILQYSDLLHYYGGELSYPLYVPDTKETWQEIASTCVCLGRLKPNQEI